jgi:apolipoprotein N-acyltransferase
MIQPNIGNYDKFYADLGPQFQEPILKKNLELTQKGLTENPQAELVVWPETALPTPMDNAFLNGPFQQQVLNFVQNKKIPFMMGTYSQDVGFSGKDYNAVFGINEQGNVVSGYRKHILLAFGEYFPGSQWFPGLKKLIPTISDFGRGDGPQVMELKETRLAPLICYEGLDVGYVAKTVELGPHILVNVTNDSWFGKNFEPYQHMIMTAARSIEHRIPLVRVTNTGISVVATATGELLGSGPQNQEWTGMVKVPYLSKHTPSAFSYLAPWLSGIYIILVITMILYFRLRRNV